MWIVFNGYLRYATKLLLLLLHGERTRREMHLGNQKYNSQVLKIRQQEVIVRVLLSNQKGVRVRHALSRKSLGEDDQMLVIQERISKIDFVLRRPCWWLGRRLRFTMLKKMKVKESFFFSTGFSQQETRRNRMHLP